MMLNFVNLNTVVQLQSFKSNRMKILIVKTSSLGDIIHTLPAVNDAIAVNPTIEFDWVVEESFAEVPAWHPAVKRIIPVALRRWRKNRWQAFKNGEWNRFKNNLQATSYDVVIDAQGLIKSALITFLSRGLRAGLNWRSAWEPLASLGYQKKVAVEPLQHAVPRVRQLFARALDYPLPLSTPRYGLRCFQLPEWFASFAQENSVAGYENKYVVFLHGTTWDTKHWPEHYWKSLVALTLKHGYHVLLPWGNEEERARAGRLANNHSIETAKAIVLPRTTLKDIAGIIAGAKAVVAVDTGLGHLAAALEVPTLSLYGPTNPELTGTVGQKQLHLASTFACAPCLKESCRYAGEKRVHPMCFSTLPPERVWELLRNTLEIQKQLVGVV
jgi:heptosyltransferase I